MSTAVEILINDKLSPMVKSVNEPVATVASGRGVSDTSIGRQVNETSYIVPGEFCEMADCCRGRMNPLSSRDDDVPVIVDRTIILETVFGSDETTLDVLLDQGSNSECLKGKQTCEEN